MMKGVLTAALVLGLCTTAHADDFEAVRGKLKDAMASEVRSEQERGRDRNRMPVETLEFFGLRDDMRVVELLPGGGWYTKLLAPVLRAEGELSVAIGASRVAEAMGGWEGFDKVRVTAEGAKVSRAEGSRFYDLELEGLGVDDVDIVFTFRNYHNFSEGGRQAMNEAAFAALKSGGVYAVVDHTRRHMEAENAENVRRFDPVLAIKEIQAAGFQFEDYATLHFRPDDELRYEVGRRSVTGNTDRWTLKFRKP